MGLDEVFDNLNEAAIEEPQAIVEEPQEPVTEPVIEAPAEEAPQEREDKSVPLATFLDMRDKQKDAERRAADYERQLAEARASQQPQQIPDAFDDPQGYARYQQQHVAEAVTAQKFEMSDLIARQSHGDETVETATAWAMEKAKANPVFAAEYMKERHPIDWIVRQHKRDSLMQQVGEDPDEFVRRRAVELGLTTSPTPPAVVAPQPTVTAPKAPPRSLVNAPSHGGVSEVPVGRLAGLDTVFPG